MVSGTKIAFKDQEHCITAGNIIILRKLIFFEFCKKFKFRLIFKLRLPNNFKNIIFQTVVKYSTQEVWFDLYDYAMKDENHVEKNAILLALLHTENFSLLKL